MINLGSLPSPSTLQAVENPVLTVPGLRTDIMERPFPYQKTDAAYMCLYKRALLAEYPAAGKKLITIMAILKLFSLLRARNALILSIGTDLTQWIEEFDKFTDGITVQLYRGTPSQRRRMLENEPDVRVATYSTVVADLPQLLNKHDILVADEVSILKNTDTNLHQHLRCLFAPTVDDQRSAWDSNEFMLKTVADGRGRPYTKRSYPDDSTPPEYAWGLSATPYETGPMDVFSLFWLLLGPHSPLGDNETRFEQLNCLVTKKKMRFRVGTKQSGKPLYRKITIKKNHGLLPNARDRVRTAIEPYYMRHPWSTVAPFLPDLQVEPRWLEFGKKQRDKYREISKGDLIYTWKQQQDRREVSHALKQFYQLRCCDGLTSLPGQNHKDSIKLQETMRLLTGEFGSEKVLIYSRFYQPLDDLEAKLTEELISYVRIDGREPDEAKNDQYRLNFTDPDGARVCLITGKGSYALNFQVARFGIAYNRLWNPAKIKQLHGRTRRRGEHDSVLWYHLLVKDTAEEVQWQTLRGRAQEGGDLIPDEDSDLFDSMTPEEQEDVTNFGLGAPT